MSEPSLTANCKSVSHAQMGVSVARLVMIVFSAGRIIILIPNRHCVWRSVVMVRSTLRNVMMVITLMVMDAARIVILRLDSHVTVDHQRPRIPAHPCFHHPFQLKTEDNQDFMERWFSMSDSTSFQDLSSPQLTTAKTHAAASLPPKSQKLRKALNQSPPDTFPQPRSSSRSR